MDFRLLYRRYARSTFAFFLRRLRDPESAADLNQELFLRVARSMENFQGRSSWRTWIFVIARNVLAEHRSQRWNRIGDRTVVLEIEKLNRDFSHGSSPDDLAEEVLLRRRLQTCLRRLDDLARTVILGHYFTGATLRELTEQLELTNASGARAVLISAQRKLRRCLERWGQE